jgi:hypothetical protein
LIEADVGRLADLDGDLLDDGIGIVRLLQQPWRFLGEDLGNAAGVVFRAAPISGLAATPGVGLRIEIVQVGERAGGEERIPDEPYGSFHATFFVAARHRDGAGFVTVMRSEVEQGRVEADRITVPLQHGAAQVIVQNDPRNAVPYGKRAEMAAQEVLHAGVEEEAQKDVPREAEHYDEGHQGTARPANHQMTEVGPVALRLFPGQRAQAQIGLRCRTWPMAGDDGAETTWPAAIAAFANHRVQAAGGQRREPGQHLADERQIGIDLRWSLWRPDARQAGLGQHTGDGFGMHA